MRRFRRELLFRENFGKESVSGTIELRVREIRRRSFVILGFKRYFCQKWTSERANRARNVISLGLGLRVNLYRAKARRRTIKTGYALNYYSIL